MDRPSKVKMKYCGTLDRFVGIRVFAPRELETLLSNARLGNRAAYEQFVVTATVLNYLSEIAPTVFAGELPTAMARQLERELFELATSVNPGLALGAVTVEATEDEEGRVHVVEAAEEGLVTDFDEEPDRFLHMEAHIHERIVGQDEAVSRVSAVIRRAVVGLASPERPFGSFVFVGQTGVGKTELARVLADFVFGGPEHLVRIDCSEYAMGHEYAKLIGAPPGFVGHGSGGVLTEALKKEPRSVVVFDEVEKAHPKVHALLLQILDAGVLTDAKGQVVSFREAIVILTSNLGVEELDRFSGSIGFDGGQKRVDEATRRREGHRALERLFPPELLNRIDAVVSFRPLDRRDEERILELLFDELRGRARRLGLELELSRRARSFLLEHGTDPKYGARPLRRALDRWVETPLAEKILSSRLTRGDMIVARLHPSKEKLHFVRKRRRQP